MKVKRFTPKTLNIMLKNILLVFLYFGSINLQAQTNTFPSSGNVGIGTLSPSVWYGGDNRVLEIAYSRPTLRLTSTVSYDLATIMFTNTAVNSSTRNGEFHLNYQYDANNAANSALRFGTYPAGEIFTLKSNGAVGIGNTTPGHRLSISGSEGSNPSVFIRNESYNSTHSNGTVSMQFAFGNHIGPKVEAYKTGTNTTGLKLYTEYGFNTNSLAMTLKPIGMNVHLVGIGTDNPTAGLDMNGSIVLRNRENSGNAGTSIHFTSYDIDHPGSLIRNNLHVANGVNSMSSLVLSSYFGSYKNELTLKNGLVGINTSNPDEALTVKGKIHTSEVRVDISPGVTVPDYVFEKSYDLLPLNELDCRGV